MTDSPKPPLRARLHAAGVTWLRQSAARAATAADYATSLRSSGFGCHRP